VRVLVVVPLTGLRPEVLAQRQGQLAALARPGTEVVFRPVGGPASIESRYEESLAAAVAVEALRVAQIEGGWDAAIVWCAADPGVAAAREVVDFPVIGPGEAACTIASLLASRFITISAVEGDRVLAQELAHRCGFGAKLAGSYAVGIPVLAMHDDEEDTVQRTVDVVRRTGAGAAALLCLGFTGLGRSIARQAGVPVVDAGAAALQMAELFVAGGYRYSRVSYPVPRKLTGGGAVSG